MTGAHEVTLPVCPSVRAGQVCLEQSIFIYLSQRAIRALREQSENSQRALRAVRALRALRALREHLESNKEQNINIRVIQSEPLNTASCLTSTTASF